MSTTAARSRNPILVALLAASSLAAIACSGGAAAPSSPPSPSPSPSASVDPGGGGSSGDPGTGIGGVPVDPAPVDPGQARLVVPVAGQLDPHPVAVTLLEPSVDGRRVIVKASWYSGVEPCNVLDSVKVDQGGNEFVLTVIEGTGDPNAMCIEIAEYRATIVDLGELAPGEYTIRASEGSEAPPVTVTVS
jgi:hypothetical protein